MDLETRRARAARLNGTTERRTFALDQVELRDADGTLTLEGYASVFDVWYEMYGGPSRYGWNEQVARTAFDRTLADGADVQLLINHSGMPLARTKSGTLDLSTDNTGLHVRAGLEPTDPDVLALRPKMERGDLDEMSMAFRVVRQEWNDDYTERTLTELNLNKGDVSVVNYGANPHTSAQVRSVDELLSEIAGLVPDEVLAEVRAAGHDPLVVLRDAGDTIARILAAAQPPAAPAADTDSPPVFPSVQAARRYLLLAELERPA